MSEEQTTKEYRPLVNSNSALADFYVRVESSSDGHALSYKALRFMSVDSVEHRDREGNAVNMRGESALLKREK